MLDDRDEPRDLFDVWFALTRADVPFEDLVSGYRARYRHDPIPGFFERARRLGGLWLHRLGYQMSGLPDLDVVLSELKAKLDDPLPDPG